MELDFVITVFIVTDYYRQPDEPTSQNLTFFIKSNRHVCQSSTRVSAYPMSVTFSIALFWVVTSCVQFMDVNILEIKLLLPSKPYLEDRSSNSPRNVCNHIPDCVASLQKWHNSWWLWGLQNSSSVFLSECWNFLTHPGTLREKTRLWCLLQTAYEACYSVRTVTSIGLLWRFKT
jgi:hypothetical protein